MLWVLIIEACRRAKALVMHTHNIRFYGDIRKIAISFNLKKKKKHIYNYV